MARLALLVCLAEPENRVQSDARGRGELVADFGIGLAVAVAALGMPEDDIRAAGIGQHLGAEIAGKGAFGGSVAILAAQRNAAAGDGFVHRREQGSGWANQQLAVERLDSLCRPRPLR